MYQKLQSSLQSSKPCIITYNNCINCKYFHNSMLGAYYGKCSRFEKQDIINWKLQYSYASIVRKYQCQGKYFEEKENIINNISNSLYSPISYIKKDNGRDI